MREILFKGKRIDTEEWVDGYLFLSCGRAFLLGTENGMPNMTELDSSTICQYTGLSDKSEQKIWENDIVRAWSEGNCAVGEIRQRIDGLWIIFPAWQDREFWGLCPNDKGETTVEVIGNVFDNPDLLKGGDNT